MDKRSRSKRTPLRQLRTAVTLILAGCDTDCTDGLNTGGPSSTLTCGSALEVVSGNNQETRAGVPATNDLVVRARVTRGTAMCSERNASGIEIAWTAIGGGAVVPATAVSDANGEARTRWVVGTQLGEQGVTAGWVDRSPNAPNPRTTATFSGIALSEPYRVLRKIAGDAQTGVASGRLTVAPEVEFMSVREAGPQLPKRQEPIGPYLIEWSVVMGGGSIVEFPIATTGLNGRLSRNWMLGPDAGPQILRATAGVPSDPRDTMTVTFNAMATAIPVQTVELSPTADIEMDVQTTTPITARTFIGPPRTEVLQRGITWRSSNETVARLSSLSGQSPSTVTIFGDAVGTADISATSEGVQATRRVTVRAAPAARRRIAYARYDHFSTTNKVVEVFNSTGGAVAVTPQSPGVFRVTFAGQQTLPSETETILVSTTLFNYYCKLGGDWTNAGPDVVAEVRCFNRDGNAVDASFSILLLGDAVLEGRFGFALAHQPLVQVYTPPKSYNSGALNPPPVSVTRDGAGDYRVTFPGNGGTLADAEAFQVTAVGTDNVRCNISDVAAATVRVRCYVPIGEDAVLTDSRFTIALLDRGRPGGARIGYAWVANPEGSEFETVGVYTLPANRAYTSNGGAVDAVKFARDGEYEVTFRGLAAGAASQTFNVQLVDRDFDEPMYCNVFNWRLDGADVVVRVHCYHTDGEPEDESFFLIVIQ